MNKKINSTDNLQGILSEAQLSDQLLHVGCGEGGCKLANAVASKGYQGYYINTAREDLNAVDADKDSKFQIPNARGCNKDRDLGKLYAAKNYDKIAKSLVQRFSTFTHYIFYCSMGGGSGSALVPMLIRALGILADESDLDITCDIVCIYPNLKEKSLKLKKNTAEFYNDLANLDNVGNIYIVNNDNYDKDDIETINNEVADTLYRIFNVAYSNDGQNIDQYEVSCCLKIPGCVAIGDIVKSSNGAYKVEFPKCFAEPATDGSQNQYIYSFADKTEISKKIQAVEEALGEPIEGNLQTFNGEKDYVVAFGLPFPTKIVNQVLKAYKESKVAVGTKDNTMKPINLDVLNDVEDEIPEAKKPKKKDTTNMFAGLMNGK